MLAFAICLLDCEWLFKHAGTSIRNLALFILLLLLGAFDAFYLAHPPLCSCALCSFSWHTGGPSFSLSGQLYDLISD